MMARWVWPIDVSGTWRLKTNARNYCGGEHSS